MIKTKNNLYARLAQLNNLYEQYENLREWLISDLEKELDITDDNDVMQLRADIEKIGEEQDTADTVKILEKDFDTIKDMEAGGYTLPYPKIAVAGENPRIVSITTPLNTDDNLVVYTSDSDYGTFQSGIMYLSEGDPFDLAMAERKQGDLAVIDGKEADNEDIDLMVYSNIFEEDYQSKYLIKRADIEKVKEDNYISPRRDIA